MSLLHLLTLSPFVLAAALPLLGKAAPRLHKGWFAAVLSAVLFAALLGYSADIRAGSPIIESFAWIPSLGISFTVYLDGLSLLFALLITGMGALVALYSVAYMNSSEESLNRFYVLLLIFMGAMLGLVLSDNLLTLYGFWELTSIASFLLIGYNHRNQRSRYGALKSLLITMTGGLGLLSGFILLYVMSGTYRIRELFEAGAPLISHPLFLPAMILILLGAFTKSAQYPFHIWLPDAMEAPTPVSAYLHSATMVKAGLYLVARLTPVFAGAPEWFWIVSLGGLVTLLYGSLGAVKQTDLKGILAYSTISQLGLMMSLLGIASLAGIFDGEERLLYAAAGTAALFHLLNHAAFKGTLFMAAGIVDHETGTRDIRKLGGLARIMPLTFTVSLFGALSMAGLPPFGGFISKEMFLESMIETMHAGVFRLQTWAVLFPVIAWIASVFTFVYSALFVVRTFFGPLKEELRSRNIHEAPPLMTIPPLLLSALALALGLFPGLAAYSLIRPAAEAMMPIIPASGERLPAELKLWHGFTPALWMTVGIVAAGSVLTLTARRWVKGYDLLPRGLSINRFYDASLRFFERITVRVTSLYMNGSSRSYVKYILGFMLLVLGFILFRSTDVTFQVRAYAVIRPYEWMILLGLAAAALAVPFAKSRTVAIILTGTIGYLMTLMFVFLRAPDLALTQMVVESISVTLFLLCFYHLPKLRTERRAVRFRLPNFLVSVAVGALMTLIALAVLDTNPFDPVSDYYVRESYESAGGKNIVNVILVDFRGFDTMLEIMVLGVASLGIYNMIKLRRKATDVGSRHVEHEGEEARKEASVLREAQYGYDGPVEDLDASKPGAGLPGDDQADSLPDLDGSSPAEHSDRREQPEEDQGPADSRAKGGERDA
ncbi:Na+/H+ antiporter subunit A [Saccharibacillus alkalitolerans]|uniref:Na+/H+ antiporter subunit A n=1 Tax=Saccharibacillus alkalitolerans TaxID=2705290 RepID=A0ABX0F9C7_9BACL|nr:Na+/H+ antiporter subunit A [Saccharibacillus alkalitolerans]NGZ77557.1 Na+/H+ antiporter subunit A [Saccharibacillus alkalitolerans]